MTVSAADAHPYPIYNARFRLVLPLLDADGDLVTGATTPDTELSQDQGTFADATNEITEIATSSGMYYLDLIATELDTNSTAIIVKSATAGMKTTPIVLYPVRLPVIRTGTAQAGAASTITLDSGASAKDDFYNGCFVNITNDSPANVRGQARRIVDYVGSTKVATIEATWGTNPSSASTFEILSTPEATSVIAWAGTPVSDPATVGIPDVNTIKVGNTTQTARDIGASVLLSAGTGTGQLDFTSGVVKANLAQILGTALTETAGQIAAAFKKFFDKATPTGTINSIPDAVAGAAGGLFIAGSNAATTVNITGNVTGNVSGSVGSVAAGGIAAASFAAGAINAAAIATGAVDADAIAADAVTEIQSGLATAASIAALNNLSAAQVNAEVDTALADVRLDELLAADSDIDGAAPPTVGSVFHELMSKTAGSFTFDQTTDSLEAVRDKATDIETDTQDIQARLPAALVSGRMDASVGAMAANTLTASALATDAVNEIVDQVWDELTADHVGAGSTGLALGSASAPSAAAVADAVWDEAIAGHLGAGSTGLALNSAGAAGDPWSTALPGAYGAGTAGKIVGDNINATISSRATPAQVQTELGTYGALKPTVAGRTLDVSAGGEAGLDWANIGSPTTAQNLSATNIDVDQVVASVSGAVGSVTGAVGSVAGNVGGNVVGSVGSVTAGVTVTTNNDKTGYGLSAAAVQAIWDALTSALTAVGSIGKLLVDNINATISSRLASASYTAPDNSTIATINSKIGTPAGASVSADVAAVKADTAAILADTGTDGVVVAAGSITALQSGLATAASIAALNNLSAAQVNAEVVDALNVDTYAQPGQDNPPAAASLVRKIGDLHKAWRNRHTQSTTEFKLYADNGTTVDQKATVSDDNTTFDRGEIGTGA